MSTERRLWLGFGTLMAILALTVLLVVYWLRSLQGNLDEITQRAQPARQAAYEMDVHNNSAGLGVLNYLHTHAAGYRERVQQDTTAFRRAFEDYNRLAPEKADIAAQIGSVFEEYTMLGARLMDRSDHESELHGVLSQSLSSVLDDLEVALQGNLDRSVAGHKLEALFDLQEELSASGVWLGSYRRTLNPEDREGLGRSDLAARTALAKYAALPLTREESEWVESFGPRVNALLEQITAVAGVIDDEQQDLQRFFYLRLRLDTLLADGALQAANRDLEVASAAARRALRSTVVSAVALLVAGLIVFLATGLVVSRGIVRTEHALREADRRKDEFVAMLAHELHNPLAPLRNGLYLLQTPGIDTSTRNRVLEMMVRQVQNMTRMIDDLLDASRITRGKIELRKQSLDLGTLVGRAVEPFRAEFEAGERTLSIVTPTAPIFVVADPTRLEQVVGNLLSNALKYTRKGGHVSVSVDTAGNDALVCVRDDGVGIAAEMLPQIFELFVQVDPSIARSQGGLGIGLTLVRTIIEMHGGSVSVDSPGTDRGSEFVVRLPRLPGAVEVQAVAEEAPVVAANGDRAPLCILVVDDNADSAESLAMLLSLRGHEVHIAHDGPSAVSLAGSVKPCLVLLDIGLPGIDGYEVARRLRQNNGSDDLLLVAVTGYGRPEDVQRAREAGFDHHVVKPVDMNVLQSWLMREGNPPMLL